MRSLFASAVLLVFCSPHSIGATWQSLARSASVSNEDGDYAKALQLYEQAMADVQGQNGDSSVLVDLSLNAADVCIKGKRPSLASNLLKSAHDQLQIAGLSNSLVEMRYWRREARLSSAQGRLDDAFAATRKALNIMKRHFSPESIAYIEELQDFQVSLIRQGRWKEALGIDREFAAALRKHPGRSAGQSCSESTLRFNEQYLDAIAANLAQGRIAQAEKMAQLLEDVGGKDWLAVQAWRQILSNAVATNRSPAAIEQTAQHIIALIDQHANEFPSVSTT